jgi:branched-chain amino acid transport system permease protein
MKSRRFIKPLSYGLLIIIFFLMPVFITGQYKQSVMIMVGINILMACSLRQVFNSGQLSMGHGGFMAVGAYTAALLITKSDLSSWAALAAGAAAAGITGLLIGLPFTRLKGIYFSLITVFLGIVIGIIIDQWRNFTGGPYGITNIPPPDSIVISSLLNISFNSTIAQYYLVISIVFISLVVMYAIEHSRIGRTFISIKESDFLAESVGVNVNWFRVLSFSIGGMFAGLAGGLYAQYLSVITPGPFGFIFSVYVMIYVIVGGLGSFAGPIIGAIILSTLPELARPLREYQPFVFSAVLMIVIFFLPDGLMSLPQKLKRLIKYRSKRIILVEDRTGIDREK